MYYDLTKEQFRKYEKEFKKTYIGRKYRSSYLISYIFAPIFFLVMNVLILLDSKNATAMDMIQLTYILVMVSFLIGGTIIWIHYMNELKEYILAKKKK